MARPEKVHRQCSEWTTLLVPCVAAQEPLMPFHLDHCYIDTPNCTETNPNITNGSNESSWAKTELDMVKSVLWLWLVPCLAQLRQLQCLGKHFRAQFLGKPPNKHPEIL